MALEDDRDGTDGLNVSRRAFLKTVGASSLAAGVIAVQLNIDGKTHRLQIEPRVTLLDAMRTRLNVTAQKRVCDRGSCGACTVLVDGRTAYACSVLAIEMQGKSIRTVEETRSSKRQR